MAALRRRADELAVKAAVHPYRTMFALLGLNLALAASFALAAAWLLGDAAEPFRELAPLTWLSFAELGFIAAVAWAVHLRLDHGGQTRWHDFWSLSAIGFVVLAVDELTQATIFLSHALERIGAKAPAGFHDLDAFLLVVLLLAFAATVVRYAPAVLKHPRACVLLAVGVVLGAASQTLDSAIAVSTAAIVVEESFKLASEPFLLGGFLLVLHEAIKRPED